MADFERYKTAARRAARIPMEKSALLSLSCLNSQGADRGVNKIADCSMLVSRPGGKASCLLHRATEYCYLSNSMSSLAYSLRLFNLAMYPLQVIFVSTNDGHGDYLGDFVAVNAFHQTNHVGKQRCSGLDD